ncbi:MAG: hypothetical protein HY303_12275, partial [Candidatus Wallbacteria bacterium]|nr:hypothetical protein [Candidatus Wallbacteria bacterium]
GLGAVFENANAVTILSETDADRARGSGRKVTSFTKVILQLVNASRKYVTVKLDPAARISSCFVGSESCSPGIGKVPGEFLLPVPRSRASQGKLDAFPVQLTYQLDLPNGFADSGTIRYGLPSFDVPVADYSWKVFTPDTYRFLKFRGDLEDTSEEAEFVLVAAAKWLFDRLLYDLAARLAALGALVGAVLWIVRVARRGFDGSTKASFVTRGSLGALAIVGIIVCGLAAIAVPNFRAARERSNTRACFANQKTIAGAVEMYNLDQNTCRKEIGVAFLQELAQQGYLQCVPDDPGCGPGSAANYFTISGGNGIACRAHGAIGEGGARVYGMEPSVPAAADPSAPAPVRASRDDRTNPINFRIPKTGQYTLLLRGFLPEGLTPSFEVRYYSAERYLQLRLLCWTVGAVLALLLVLPAAGRRSTVPDVALMAALLAALLGLDAQAPALAAESFGAWVTALGLGLPLVVFGARIERMMVRMEDGDAPPLGSIATKTLLSLLTIVALTPSVRAEDLEMRLFAPSARADASAALLMPRSDFKRLSAAAGAAVTAAATKADGLPGLLLEEASYRVVPSYPVSEVEARYRIWGHGSGWRSIELAGAGLDAAAAPEVVSGRAASVLSAGAPGRFLVDLEGSTEIRQRFSAPVAREGNRFRIEFAAPRSPINSLRLADLPAGFREFRVAGGVAGPDGSEFRFPAAERVRLEWTNAAPSPVQAAKPEETFETHSQIESSLWLAGHAAERVLRLEGRLDLEVSRRPVSRTVVELHPSLAVVDARAPELADWSIEPVPGSAAQRLVIEWKAPFAGRAQVQLMLEVSREGDAPFELGLPAVAGAQREHVTLGVSGQGNLLVEPGKLPDGVRQGDPSQPPQELSRPGARPLALLLTAARHGGSGAGAAAPVQLRVTRLQQVQLLAAVADLAEFSVHAARDGQLMGHGHWLVKNNSEQFLRLRMPEGARLLDCFVSGTAVTPAAGPSGELLLPLEKSGVRNTQAAAFPVDLGWLEVRKPLEEGATMRLTLPHVQLPVSTLRLKLGMPRDLDAVPVSTNLQADASYREVSYAGENGEREAEASGRRLFEQSAPPLKVPFPEMTQVENYSRDIVDPSGSAPFLETRIAARQTSRFNRSLGFSAALLLAFGFVLHGPTARSRKRRLAAVLVVSGVAVGVTSFRPESLALGLYFALGLFLGAALGLLRWLAELRPVSPALSPRFPPGN